MPQPQAIIVTFANTAGNEVLVPASNVLSPERIPNSLALKSAVLPCFYQSELKGGDPR